MTMKIPLNYRIPKGVEIDERIIDIERISRSIKAAVFEGAERFMKLIKSDTLIIYDTYVAGYRGKINGTIVINLEDILYAIDMTKDEFTRILTEKVIDKIGDGYVIDTDYVYFPEISKKHEIISDNKAWKYLAINLNAVSDIIEEALLMDNDGNGD